MMVAESTQLEKRKGLANGTFKIKAGGAKFKGGYNRYAADELIGSTLDYVTVRFDPYHLHDEVCVFDSQDHFLCKAQCIDKVAFDSTEMARQHKRAKAKMVSAVKAKARAEERMNAIEMASYTPELEEIEEVKPIIKPFLGFNGNVALKPQAHEFEEENEENQLFAKGWEKVKQDLSK